MLIVRSPLRISLAGGGTDLPVYYRKHGGVVINTAIDRYFYVFLRTLNSNVLEISSADFQTFFRHSGMAPLGWEGDLELPRAIFNHFGVAKGIQLFIASEIPPGTGLGSSSSVSVGADQGVAGGLRHQWIPSGDCGTGLLHRNRKNGFAHRQTGPVCRCHGRVEPD